MLEISLTKMKQLGFDINGLNWGFMVDEVADLMKAADRLAKEIGKPATANSKSDPVLGLLDWLEQNDIAKVLTRPAVMTTEGRPASIQVIADVPLPSPNGG